jgi:hypothetical protein
VGVDVLGQQPSYGLELVDAITGGPLVGPSHVVETSGIGLAFRARPSCWVFEGLSTTMPANFKIEALHYIAQQITTDGVTYPNPTAGVASNVVQVTMMPRTGYPFSPTLTRVVGLVRVDPASNPASPVVVGAVATITPIHYYQPPTPPPPAPQVPPPPVIVPDTPFSVPTTDDGQYTAWFFPDYLGNVQPAIPNQLSITVTATGFPAPVTVQVNPLTPNGVTYAPTVLLVP